jgi:putative acyl-CoA dehydrogenase
MSHRPTTQLPTHTVTNQPPPLVDWDLWDTDAALRESVLRAGGADAAGRAAAFGRIVGQADVAELSRQANEHPPILRTFNRYGQRVDEVEFHPAYHELFDLAATAGVHNAPWAGEPGGSHVTHAALEYLFGQIEQGVCCPLTMTYAAVPALRAQPDVAAQWVPKAIASDYDPRCLPLAEKSSVKIGMAMTEKQGGSDVRANTTRAVRTDDGWRLTGHKWFCSAPMCDAFLTLAQTDAGLSCFLVPRWLPDGSRNPFFLQRLKDKLGNKSNASSEVEYLDTWGSLLGEEGRGVRTILEMVHHTRLDCTIAAAGLVRQSFVQAAHHATGRVAFGHKLIDKPLMRNVLADLALDSEVFTLASLRLAEAFDASDDPNEAAFARVAVAVTKYWTNKRCPTLVVEALECLGGVGYVEESGMPRLYREAPLNSIWEGSGNVICLDVLRAMHKEPDSLPALLAELRRGRGVNRHLDAWITDTERDLADRDDLELRARRLVERLALGLLGSLAVRYSPPAVADAWCATRLGGVGGVALGTLPRDADLGAILERAWPAIG